MVVISSFYQYVDIDAPDEMAAWQREQCVHHGLLGRVVVAREGINGTLSGSEEAITAYASALRSKVGDVDIKTASASVRPFPDLFVKVSKEIVGTGVMRNCRGPEAVHLDSAEFRARLATALVLDVRNSFEYDVGHFDGAHRAPVRTMSDWARWFDHSGLGETDRDVLLYCTGGVRCEKAGRYLRAKGHAVYLLDGGIHRFLEHFADGGGVWKGRNFVFDARELEPQPSADVVGRCTHCDVDWETHCGRHVCSVCASLCLVCADCSLQHHEHYCDAHAYLRGAYCHFLDRYTDAQLARQIALLDDLLATSHQAACSVNVRRALRKQRLRIESRLAQLSSLDDDDERRRLYDGPPRCRSCENANCSGTCWGFWKAAATGEDSSCSFE